MAQLYTYQGKYTTYDKKFLVPLPEDEILFAQVEDATIDSGVYDDPIDGNIGITSNKTGTAILYWRIFLWTYIGPFYEWVESSSSSTSINVNTGYDSYDIYTLTGLTYPEPDPSDPFGQVYIEFKIHGSPINSNTFEVSTL